MRGLGSPGITDLPRTVNGKNSVPQCRLGHIRPSAITLWPSGAEMVLPTAITQGKCVAGAGKFNVSTIDPVDGFIP